MMILILYHDDDDLVVNELHFALNYQDHHHPLKHHILGNNYDDSHGHNDDGDDIHLELCKAARLKQAVFKLPVVQVISVMILIILNIIIMIMIMVTR